MYLFEITDVVLVDARTESGARNERHLVALQTHKDASGFEYIHGLLDHLMIKTRVKRDEKLGYSIRESKGIHTGLPTRADTATRLNLPPRQTSPSFDQG
jgi:phenylalanyl-tRNA synthetase beta subunit